MKTIIMRSTLGFLRRIYLWPKSEKSTTKPAYLCFLFASFLLVGSFLRLIISNENDNIIMDSLKNVISQFGTIYFSLFFLLNRRNTVKIVSELSDFATFGKPRHFDARNKEIDAMGRCFTVILYITIVTVFLWPALYTKHCEESREVCGLVAPVWLPFDFGYFPAKQIVYLWQCYCCLVTYGAGGMLSVAMWELMEHLVVRIQHLKTLIAEVVEESDPMLRQKLLEKWIQYHLHIFKIGKEMNKNYRISLSVHVLVAGALFGFIGHTLTENASTLDSVGLFAGWFSSLFVVCLGGQHLMDESISVAMALYQTKWYQQDGKFQKDLIPIMIRSQKPIVIHAGPFTHLSLLLILSVLQTAYSYVNLLSATS